MARRSKVSVIGAGNVGASTAQGIMAKELADVVLVDIVEGMPQGKALDLRQSSSVDGWDVNLAGSNGYKETENSDVVVITSGLPRKPGMSRDDLLAVNQKIVSEVTGKVMEASPNCILILVSNPLDAMCHVAYEVSGLPRERIMGMAGVLDTSRYKAFVAEAVGVSVADIHGFVLGGHGDTMVPMPRHTSVAGIPLTEFLSADKIQAIVDRTAGGGAEIVKLLKTGSAYYAPALSVVAMVESIIRDRKRVLPCAALLKGEYGIDGLFLGVPVVLGTGGIEKVLEIELNKDEKAAMDHSAEAVKNLVEALKKVKD